MKIFIVLFVLWALFVSFVAGYTKSSAYYLSKFSSITGGVAEIANCIDVGCSILVKNTDQSKRWVWIPSMNKAEKE